jgi:hypothetical protein
MSDGDKLREAESISLELRPIVFPKLRGKDPEVQGAVLADLVSVWLAGHHPELRDEVLRMHTALVRELIPISDREMFGDAGHPGRNESLREFSRADWLKLPLPLRRRWWRETDYGKRPPTNALRATVKMVISGVNQGGMQ